VKLRSDFGSGVCLIAATYYFVESGTGRPLRYSGSANERKRRSSSKQRRRNHAHAEGMRRWLSFSFRAPAFNVGDGFVVTNRHIAQPWLADERAQV